MFFDIKNNSNQILTSGKSSANKDSDSNSIILNLGTSFIGDRDQFDDDLAKGD